MFFEVYHVKLNIIKMFPKSKLNQLKNKNKYYFQI